MLRTSPAWLMAAMVDQFCGSYRHDHSSNFLADHFHRQIKFWGITPSYAFVGEPQTNGVIEKPLPDPIPLKIQFPISPRPKIGFWP